MGRSWRLIWTSAILPRFATIQNATSESASCTHWPSPVRERWRSAASRLAEAIIPVIASQAGSRWLNGTLRLRGPVAHGKPVAGLTV